MRNTLGIFGYGGFAKEVVTYLGDSKLKFDEVVFVDREKSEPFHGYRVLGEDDFYSLSGNLSFVIAIADSKARKEISSKAKSYGVASEPLIANPHHIGLGNSIGEGLIAAPFVTITSNSRIGNFVHLNIYSYVAHDCCIGDFVTFAPGVKCNGNVIIENNVYIGTGAVIREGTPESPIVIGEGSTIGMGAVVTKSVSADTVVVGNPARLLER